VDVPRFTAFALTLALAACGLGDAAATSDAGPDDVAADAGEPLLEIGTGRDGFVALHDGDELELIHGPQGGYHLWGAVRARNLAPAELTIDYAVTLDGPPATEVSKTPYKLTLVKRGAGYEWSGLIGYVPDPQAAYGRRVTLSMTATDTAGRHASDHRSVLVKAAPP
jgi:hypothetical protein